MQNLKTAECVTPMHPDKLCDRISDAILDACLAQDPDSRVAIETMGGHGIITITGEITTNAYINAREIAQGIAGKQYGVQTNIVAQSPEIAQGVDGGGAGDQGIMVGYACNDNPALIPQELHLARLLCSYLFIENPYDGKTQITIRENGDVDTIVASFQNTSKERIHDGIIRWLDTCNVAYKSDIKVHANPAGDWSQGGFEADTGLTGRKLAVDNMGPQIPIGGGAFSGKDATKVDRTGAYMARKMAVDILKSSGAKNVTVKLAYAIGVAEPVMISVRMEMPNGKIIEDGWDFSDYKLTPKGMIEFLDLKKPQFENIARWGHFGRGFKWDI